MAAQAKLWMLTAVAALAVRAHGEPPVAGPAKDFASAYASAADQAAKAFEAALPLDAAKVVSPLRGLAVQDEDKKKVESLGAAVAQMGRLRTPVAAKTAADGDPLDPAYKKDLLALSQQLKADSDAALETRRRLLRGEKALPQSAAETPASEKDSVDQGAARGAAASDRARRIANGLEQNKTEGVSGPAAGPSPAPHPTPTPGPDAALRAADFQPEAHPKLDRKTAVDAPAASPAPPEAPGVWSRVKGALGTTWGSAEETYKDFAADRMKASEQRQQEGAELLEKGGVLNTVAAGWKATQAFGDRVLAGDKKAVTAVAVGAAVVTAAVVAAPVIAGGSVVVGTVEGGLAAWTAYNVVHGAAKLAQEPNAANAGLLALNFAPVPFLGKISKAVGGKVEQGVIALEHSAKESRVAALTLTTLGVVATKVGATEVKAVAREGAETAVNAAAKAEVKTAVREVAETSAEIAEHSVHGTVHKTADHIVEAQLEPEHAAGHSMEKEARPADRGGDAVLHGSLHDVYFPASLPLTPMPVPSR